MRLPELPRVVDDLVDLGDFIAFPGLTNSHDHLEFDLHPPLGRGPYADYVAWGRDIHRRDRAVIEAVERVPRAVRLRWGGLRNLLCGVTSVAHHGDRRDDLRALPVRALPSTSIHSVRRARHWRLSLNAPLRRGPFVFHVAEGTSRAAGREAGRLLRWNLLGRPLVGVHAIAMRPEQAARFRAVVWCPVSNERLYGTTADVTALGERTAILFGTDSTLTGDWDVWAHLRRARALGLLDDRRLLDALTRTAASVWGHDPVRDVVVARRRAPGLRDAFFAVTPEDIVLVRRSGETLLSDVATGVPVRAGPSSILRLGSREKRVAEDVPGLLARVRAAGLEPNLPISATGPLQ